VSGGVGYYFLSPSVRHARLSLRYELLPQRAFACEGEARVKGGTGLVQWLGFGLLSPSVRNARLRLRYELLPQLPIVREGGFVDVSLTSLASVREISLTFPSKRSRL
jgi:hypothetical protein